jgi:hypothetical protein
MSASKSLDLGLNEAVFIGIYVSDVDHYTILINYKYANSLQCEEYRLLD